MNEATKYREIDFGCVVPGKMYTKKIKIKSPYKMATSGPVLSHPLEEAFTIMRSPKKKDYRQNKFIIQFYPLFPWHLSAAYVAIKGTQEVTEHLSFKGQTKGPQISLKKKQFMFFTNNKTPKRSCYLHLTNSNACPDFFLWDLDVVQSEISFQPRSGLIKGNETVKVIVTFHPRSLGLFYRTIYCLFTMHEPLMAEFYCIHTKTESKVDLKNFITSTQPLPTYPSIYCRFINDVAKTLYPESKPLLILSHRYMDLGSLWLEGNKVENSENLVLTSHFFTDVYIVWDEDVSNVFFIQPRTAYLKRGGKITFTVTFRPKHQEMLFGTELHAAIQWGCGREFLNPFPLSICLIGNTFPPKSCGWDPFAVVDKKRVILPATVPLVPSYTSFTIKRTSDLPVQFKLYPRDVRDISRFVVKPRHGIIVEDFQVIVVQLFPGEKTDEPHIEKWVLLLNLVHTINIELCGTVEKPFLKIAKTKDIIFPMTNVNMETSYNIAFKNPTRLHLRYHCKEVESNVFKYDTNKHSIGPNEEQSLVFSFLPKEIGEFRMTLGVEIEWWDRLPKADPVSDPRRNVKTETVLYLHGTSEKCDMTCCPDYILIDNVLKNNWGEGTFLLENNGNSVAYVLLECVERVIGSHAGPSEFIPNNIEIAPNKSILVTVRCKGEHVGIQSLQIVYSFTSRDYSKITGERVFLLALDVCCIFPLLKVIDVRHKSLCKNLPKIGVWRMLMINNLNKHLERTYIKPEQRCYMKIPEDTDNTPYFIVQFLVKNISQVPVAFDVIYVKSCECHFEKGDRRASRLSNKPCQHRQELTCKPLKKTIMPCSTTIVEMCVAYNYTVQNYFKVHWIIKAVDEPNLISTITFFVERNLLNADKGSLDLYYPGPNKEVDLRFEPVYIGDNNYYVQYVWMYNNSSRDIEYNCRWLSGEPEVFKIINPSSKVLAISHHPLLIKFCPFEFVEYSATLLVQCLDTNTQIRINFKGQGDILKNNWTFHMAENMPLTSLFPEDEPFLQAELSVTHICLEPMPIHSYTKKTFFLKNKTNDVLEFDWRKTFVWGLVEIEVSPNHGFLMPGELIPCHMLVKSLRFPAKITCAVECVLKNKTMTNTYKEKTRYMARLARIFDACFTITNDGEFHPPEMGIRTGEAPLNTFLSLGVSFLIYNSELENQIFPNIEDQIKIAPGKKLDIFEWQNNFDLTANEADTIVKTLVRALGDVMKEQKFLIGIEKTPKYLRIVENRYILNSSKQFLLMKSKVQKSIDILDCQEPHVPEVPYFTRYVELEEYSEELQKPTLQSSRMASVITNVLYENLMNIFKLKSNPVCEDMIKHSKFRRIPMNNVYYSDVISREVSQVLHDPNIAGGPSEVSMCATREYSGFLNFS